MLWFFLGWVEGREVDLDFEKNRSGSNRGITLAAASCYVRQ